jgi:FtsX extracellular domain
MAAMSRGRWLLPLAVVALVLTGCGGSGTPGASTATGSQATLVTAGLTPPAGCYLTVFLIESVSKSQTLHVQSQLLANRLITQVSFVPKALELRRFAQTHPLAAQGFAVNPFTDRFEVVPRTHGSMFAIISGFATHGGPITNVTPNAACGQAQ